MSWIVANWSQILGILSLALHFAPGSSFVTWLQSLVQALIGVKPQEVPNGKA